MAPDARADHLVVVVGASGTAPKLSSEQVSANFLGSVKSFPNGEKAIPVDQTAGSSAYVQFYVQFYGQVAGRSEAQTKAYWSRMVFTGRGRRRRRPGTQRPSRSWWPAIPTWWAVSTRRWSTAASRSWSRSSERRAR